MVRKSQFISPIRAATRSGLDLHDVERLGGWQATTVSGSNGTGFEKSVAELSALSDRIDVGEILSGLPRFTSE